MLRRLNKGAQLSSVSKNNFYFWQLEMESIKDDPDLLRSSVISLELTGHHQPPNTSNQPIMTNSVLTSVLILIAALSLVMASTQTEREGRQAVIVSETMQVITILTS